MLTSIVDGDSRAVHIGMPVEVAFGWLPIKSASLRQGRPVSRQSNRTIGIHRNRAIDRKCWTAEGHSVVVTSDVCRKCWLADLMHSG